jgi:hypothetical protein
MNEYKVYFEIYGKKMQAKVSAETIEEAREAIYAKLIFHQIDLISGSEPTIKPWTDQEAHDFLFGRHK